MFVVYSTVLLSVLWLRQMDCWNLNDSKPTACTPVLMNLWVDWMLIGWKVELKKKWSDGHILETLIDIFCSPLSSLHMWAMWLAWMAACVKWWTKQWQVWRHNGAGRSVSIGLWYVSSEMKTTAGQALLRHDYEWLWCFDGVTVCAVRAQSIIHADQQCWLVT